MELDELNAQMMPFATAIGIRFIQVDPDEIVATLYVRDDLCTAGQVAHGGALMALADSVGAVGTVVNLPGGAKGTTTIESKTNLVGAAPAGATLVAKARPIHRGRRTQVWQTRVETDEGRLVSITTQTQMVL